MHQPGIGDKGIGTVPLSYTGPKLPVAGVERTTTRVTGEVTFVFTTV
jgi:hypothetical protein